MQLHTASGRWDSGKGPEPFLCVSWHRVPAALNHGLERCSLPAVLLCGQLFVGRPQGSAEELWVPLLSLLLRGAVVQHSTGTPQEPSRRCSQPGLWCCSVPCWATARSPQTAATSSASSPVVKGANQQVYCHALQAPEEESRLRVSNFAAIIFDFCLLQTAKLRTQI